MFIVKKMFLFLKAFLHGFRALAFASLWEEPALGNAGGRVLSVLTCGFSYMLSHMDVECVCSMEEAGCSTP